MRKASPDVVSNIPFHAQHLDKVDRDEGQYKCRNIKGEGQDRVPIVFVIRSVYQGEYQPGKIPGSLISVAILYINTGN